MEFTEWILGHLLYCKGTWEEAYHIRGLEVQLGIFHRVNPNHSLVFYAFEKHRHSPHMSLPCTVHCLCLNFSISMKTSMCMTCQNYSNCNLCVPKICQSCSHNSIFYWPATGRSKGSINKIDLKIESWSSYTHSYSICRSLMCWHYREKIDVDHPCNRLSFDKLIHL